MIIKKYNKLFFFRFFQLFDSKIIIIFLKIMNFSTIQSLQFIYCLMNNFQPYCLFFILYLLNHENNIIKYQNIQMINNLKTYNGYSFFIFQLYLQLLSNSFMIFLPYKVDFSSYSHYVFVQILLLIDIFQLLLPYLLVVILQPIDY